MWAKANFGGRAVVWPGKITDIELTEDRDGNKRVCVGIELEGSGGRRASYQVMTSLSPNQVGDTSRGSRVTLCTRITEVWVDSWGDIRVSISQPVRVEIRK